MVALAIWPAVHIGLVARYDLNPWKLGGWGMYSAPQLASEVRVSCLTPDVVGIYELRSIRPDLQPSLHQFRRRRLALGSLARPDRFAQAVLDHYPAIDGVVVEVVQPVLDPRTGMIRGESSRYEYLR